MAHCSYCGNRGTVKNKSTGEISVCPFCKHAEDAERKIVEAWRRAKDKNAAQAAAAPEEPHGYAEVVFVVRREGGDVARLLVKTTSSGRLVLSTEEGSPVLFTPAGKNQLAVTIYA